MRWLVPTHLIALLSCSPGLNRNYAKSHPDLCILAVNTFVQDSEHPNPLIRALAIRTMGCIQVDKILDYMYEPLRKTLDDESPYVRKTAVLSVAKLFELNPQMCIENGFIETVQKLIGDPNPMVVANSVTALIEINEADPSLGAFVVTAPTLKKMLLALNECTEWGRIKILSCLALYRATDSDEVAHICERVAPQLQHANPSVVLGAIKVVFLHRDMLSPELRASYLKKMAPPLGMSEFLVLPSLGPCRLTSRCSDACLLRARGPVRRSPQHQPASPVGTRHPKQGNARVLLQIQ